MLRDLKPKGLAEAMQIHPNSVYAWLWGERFPTEENFFKLCEVLDVPDVQLTAQSKEIRDRARHERAMKHYHAEMLDELPIADYREVQLIESDIERTSELDPSSDDAREGEIIIPSEVDAPHNPESDSESGDADAQS